jgi:hypothetical protein
LLFYANVYMLRIIAHFKELRIEKRYDPFLVARCGRERFYIDVWKEADFEKENC